MRVLHVSAGNLYGGVETVLVTLARLRGLAPALEPEFALCFAGRAEQELCATGATVHRLGDVRVRRPLSILRARRTLRALVERRGIETVVCHSPWSQAIFGPAVRAAGAASVLWLHDVLGGRHWVERWAARARPDGAICGSRFNAGTLRVLYPRPPQLPYEVVYCPVPKPPPISEAVRAEIRDEFGVHPDSVVIIQVGRMEKLKGHRVHLAALQRLKNIPRWVCWIVGGAQRPHEASYLESLRTEAAALGIASRVRFLGQRDDIRRLLAAADIKCQPNVHPESFGLVFIEALLAGLPVVTTAMGGALEIVDGSCGVLVKPGDPDGLADTLRDLIQDGELRRRLGAAGPARAASLCDPQRQMQALTRALIKIFSASRAASNLRELRFA
jgi:glycosyltransferase involved in cell wall biosynthesis